MMKMKYINEIKECIGKKRQYDEAIQYAILALTNKTISFDVINNVDAFTKLTSNLGTALPKLKMDSNLYKASYLILIAIALNNKVTDSFIPRNSSIKTCIKLQKLSLFYIKKGISLLMTYNTQIPFEWVNEINFLLNLIDTNLAILTHSNARLFDDGETRARFLRISRQLEDLIYHESKLEYCRLHALVLLYLDDKMAAMNVTVDGIQSQYISHGILNIDRIKYQLQMKGKTQSFTMYGV